MKVVYALILFSLVLASAAFAAEPAKMDPKTQEIMKKYEEAGTPGEAHKRLEPLAGKWKTSTQMWQSANAKPEVAKGSAEFKMILGGRWLQQEMKGTAMGQPFQGMGLLGYDNVKEKYSSIWLDSMSTTAMRAEGTYDPSTKTLKDQGTYSDPLTATKTQDFRSEWQMPSKDKMVFSLFGKGPEGGPEFKMMEVTYTR